WRRGPKCHRAALMLPCWRDIRPEKFVTEQPVVQPAEARPAELPSRLALAARRARYAILWERGWPPLAALATAAGVFLPLALRRRLAVAPPPRPPRGV